MKSVPYRIQPKEPPPFFCVTMGNMTTSNTAGDHEPPRTKQMPCRYCGAPITVGVRKRVLPHHLECALKVMMDNMQQVAEKSGPYYERWRAGCMRRPGGRPRGRGVSRETAPPPNDTP